MSFVGLCVWVLGPQLVALFSEAVEPLGGGGSQAEVSRIL